jgi:hypothetical protein
VSVKVSTRVWESSQSTLGARLVMLYLADCAHEDGSNIYPSITTISKNTKLSERQVQRQIKHLIASGELVDVGRSPLNTRQFRIPMTPEMSPRHIVTPDIQDAKGVTDHAENDAENVTRSVIRDPLGEIRISFEVFYEAYPKHEAKQDAMKAWSVLRPNAEMCDRIMSDIERFRGRERQFIPLPATYIRGRRWEDEQPVAAAPKPPPPAVIEARRENAEAIAETLTPEQIEANKELLASIRRSIQMR